MKQYKQKRREEEGSKRHREERSKEGGGGAQDVAEVNVDFKDAKPEQQPEDLSDIFLFSKERKRE